MLDGPDTYEAVKNISHPHKRMKMALCGLLLHKHGLGQGIHEEMQSCRRKGTSTEEETEGEKGKRGPYCATGLKTNSISVRFYVCKSSSYISNLYPDKSENAPRQISLSLLSKNLEDTRASNLPDPRQNV